MLERPLSIYINWASYDELSDVVQLTEALAMEQFAELLRLRGLGVRFDCYLMDAFWYEPGGAYRTWRKAHWPQGPDRWLNACRDAGVKPGMWFSGNTLCKLDVAPVWRDSLDADGHGMCMFHGGFLADFMEVLRSWYARGVRVFKLDFINFSASPAVVRNRLLPPMIRARNMDALRLGLEVLRQQCPEIILLGYNGFEEAPTQSATDLPLCRSVDNRWLDAFDTLYCGDPRPADVPAMNFWRSKDVYSDHMVRAYERNGFPLARIDNAGFMIGKTGTCYGRGTAAWKGMLLLSLARGGWMNTYYGNLELLDTTRAAWFAKVQAIFLRLQAYGRFATFGGMPGEGRPYGYVAESAGGSLITVVNPAQSEETVRLPCDAEGRILFRDAGYMPVLRGGSLTLGAEQMAVVGTGEWNAPGYDMGVQDDVRIPATIKPLKGEAKSAGPKDVEITLAPPADGCVRVMVRQKDRQGKARRTTGGAPPDGIPLGRLLVLVTWQQGKKHDMEVNYDKAIWSGLSWAVGEVRVDKLARGVPLKIRAHTEEQSDVTLGMELFHTTYGVG